MSADASDPAHARRPADDKIVSIVDRAASLLDCFAAERGTMSLAELAARLALPKPTVFRIATVLARLGLLEQAAAGGAYSIGLAAMRYGDALLGGLEIRRLARPFMERLRDELNETVVLSVRDGDVRYNIDSVESTHAIGQTQQIGVPVPLYAGAASRAILAAMPDAQIDDYLNRVALAPFSATTITDPARLRAEIAQARRLGYVVTSGEFTPRGHAAARPIKAPAAFGSAALHVSIPPARKSKALERKALDALLRATQDIADAAYRAGDRAEGQAARALMLSARQD